MLEFQLQQNWKPSNDSGSISFRIDWFDLFTIQGLPRNLLQYHNSKASILQHSAFFMVQLTSVHDYWGEKIALILRTFVGKVMSLLFKLLSSFIIVFLPRSKSFLISWLQSLSAVILEPKKIKSFTISLSPHLFSMKWWDQMPWALFFECWVLSQLFHSPFTFIKRLIKTSSLSTIRVV